MPKHLPKLIIGVLFATSAAAAQTTAPSGPNAQNPEATCPVGANCAPGQPSQGAAAPPLGGASQTSAPQTTGAIPTAEGSLSLSADQQLKIMQFVRQQKQAHLSQTVTVGSTLPETNARIEFVRQPVRLWIDSLEGLLGLVQTGVTEVHSWGATVDDFERPDTLVFDLDPGSGVAWDLVTDTALRLREMMCKEGFEPWPKVTGGKGLHLMVPLDRQLSWERVRALCKGIAQGFAATDPARYTASSTANRAGRIFVDYLRNGRGQTAIGAYSPRAGPGFPVAAPITWHDVEKGTGQTRSRSTNYGASAPSGRSTGRLITGVRNRSQRNCLAGTGVLWL